MAPHPISKEAYEIARHHSRVNAEDVSLLRIFLGVLYSLYKEPSAPVVRRMRVHPTRRRREERPLREGGNSQVNQVKLPLVPAHIRRPVFFVL